MPLNEITSLESLQMIQNENLIETQSIPSALVSYSLGFPHTHGCYSNKTESVSSMLQKTVITTTKKFQPNLPIQTIIVDTNRHNIAQMTSTNRAYISCLLTTMINGCHILASDRRQHLDGGC